MFGFSHENENPHRLQVNKMMSFMSKKKRFKFVVNFGLEELSSVPFVSGILFAKLRLLEGGSFVETSNREEVKNNCVKWKTKYSFQCKMTASANTGYLDPCVCRISVRRELKGGKACQKLGFVDLNLAEYAGSGVQTRKFLLQGYDTKHRQDNSTLEVTLEMQLVSGDPVFKVPNKVPRHLPGETTDEQPETRVGVEESSSLASNSSGFGSLPRKDKPSIIPPESTEQQESSSSSAHDFEKSHSRNNSYASQQSGYHSLSHSRQSSFGNVENTFSHTRSPSAGSALLNELSKGERRKKFDGSMKGRVDKTRVDADDVVNELLSTADLGLDDVEQSSGLQLLVDKDGTMALR